MGTLADTLTEVPPIKSIGEYDFPSRSAQELYGDDLLVHVWWKGNPWFVAAATFRAPAAMPWADFWNGLFVPYHEEDPDFDAAKGWEQFDWFLAVNREEHPVTIDPARTLSELGVTHKGVLGFRTRA
ncbi:MAG: phenol hydroxylase [Actinomycetales bacterium]|nr:phenol hydroxylase [Actinomycetales bacterium]